MDGQRPTMRNQHSGSRRGMTIVEVTVSTLVCLLLAGLMLPALARPRGCCGRQPKDGTQVRNVVQAMMTFATSNRDRFPLPSLIDTADATVPQKGDAKNITANMLSILIQNGGISPEICVSPAEASGSIRIMDDYESSNPSHAVIPGSALW